MSTLIFVKLGGSLITDKRKPATARTTVIQRLARELRKALLDDKTALRVVLGHGSGSFGHWEASHYGTRQGVKTPAEWYGFARVSAAALRLNRLVTNTCVREKLAVLSLQPCASALADQGNIIRLEIDPIRRALTHGLVPLVFGDVAFDASLGGTILSTEDIFAYLATLLHPSWILLLGNAPGVLDPNGETIPTITPDTLQRIQPHLQASAYTDVTGGMADKVQRMTALVQRQPNLRVRIMSGSKANSLYDALKDPDHYPYGTVIRASTTPS